MLNSQIPERPVNLIVVWRLRSVRVNSYMWLYIRKNLNNLLKVSDARHNIYSSVDYLLMISALLTSYHTRMFLNAFENLQKVTNSFIRCVRPSLYMEQIGSHSSNFDKVWYLIMFRKPVEKI